ncbi:potassium voltage-gated channel protein Shaw-like [Mizuhopecten yessoensis]|uniref:Potassium voltage-gated channel protein Shaw n=1 Tax=Mizuhopecten yessoensis TaxID=6573 RepID=A0A210QCW5_MIZYE|nr:potassium voltage-gated channel protein Shaw-like [Mizuhopecten yessoensis]OWF46555.1 Potassium voltage-gated channel protein Shaw [Mizuhopecten yessoensis]
MERVMLNVGGRMFETTYATLHTQPETRLGKLSMDSNEYCEETKQFFFDRNPDFFNSLLDFYRTGELHLPSCYCGASLRHELSFWELQEEDLSECCLQVYYKYDNDKETMKTLEASVSVRDLDYTDKECAASTFVCVKRAIWLFLDQPKSSFLAKMFNFLYFFVVVVSILMFLFGSHPWFRYDRDFSGHDNDTIVYWLAEENWENPKERLATVTEVYPALLYIERTCMFFFTAELVLHFLTSPNKNRFFGSWMNAFDTVLVIIMLIVFGMETRLEVVISSRAGAIAYLLFKSSIICRLFRLFRLVNQYSALRILFATLRSSLKELVLLLALFLMSVTIFAGFVYYAEFEEPTTFPDLFVAIWWAVITMTTVGYGDQYPKTHAGRAVGVCCAMCGLLILSMPIAIVASNFNDFHLRNKDRERFLLRKQKRTKKSSVSPVSLKKKACSMASLVGKINATDDDNGGNELRDFHHT